MGAAVNQVTTNELARFESNERLKTNMHTFKANHKTLMLITYRLYYFLLPCVYVSFTLGQGGAKWTPPSLYNIIAPDEEHIGEQYVYQEIPDPIIFHQIISNPIRRSRNARDS